jgi:hypothetical protein
MSAAYYGASGGIGGAGDWLPDYVLPTNLVDVTPPQPPPRPRVYCKDRHQQRCAMCCISLSDERAVVAVAYCITCVGVPLCAQCVDAHASGHDMWPLAGVVHFIDLTGDDYAGIVSTVIPKEGCFPLCGHSEAYTEPRCPKCAPLMHTFATPQDCPICMDCSSGIMPCCPDCHNVVACQGCFPAYVKSTTGRLRCPSCRSVLD